MSKQGQLVMSNVLIIMQNAQRQLAEISGTNLSMQDLEFAQLLERAKNEIKEDFNKLTSD